MNRLEQTVAAHPERLTQERRAAHGKCVEPDEMRRCLPGEHRHPARGRMDALAQRLPVQPGPAADLPRHHHLSVEHTTRREFVAHRLDDLGEIPAEVLAAARQQRDLVAIAEHQRPSS